MKTSLPLLSILIAGFILSCNPLDKDEFRLIGTIAGMDTLTGSVAMPCDTAPRGMRYDEVQFENGRFEYTTRLTKPQVVRMWINKDEVKKIVGRGYIPVKSSVLWFVAMPGKQVYVEGEVSDFVDAYPREEMENEKLAELFRSINPVINAAGNLMVEQRTNDTLSEEEKAAIGEQITALEEKEQELKEAFVDQHISSLAGLWILEDMVIRRQIGMDKVADWLGQVDEQYQGTDYYQSLATRVEGFKASQVGQPAPAIKTTNTPDGSLFDLDSLKGKYVLLDFWGTWCGSCIAGIPAMKEFMQQHAEQLEVVGLAQDRDAELWKQFILDRKMNWHHVLIGEGADNYVEKYNVAGFPTKILLSPEGIILHRTVGEEEGYYEEIEGLLK